MMDTCISNPLTDCTMTKLDTTPFKAQLLEQRASLLGQLATLRGGDVTRAEASAEHFSRREDSQAQTTTERELELTLDSRETTELDAVEAALKRIAAGTYGECTDCGVHIPAARLQATPEAPRCIHCQEKAEKA
jgi:DnaK suppressor protein